jgi:hypothetical protein
MEAAGRGFLKTTDAPTSLASAARARFALLEIRVGGRRFRTTLVAAPRSLVSTMVAPDLATADAATYGSAMLDSFKIDISHQEMERIIIELELIYKTQPGQWLPITVRAAVPSHSARRRKAEKGV